MKDYIKQAEDILKCVEPAIDLVKSYVASGCPTDIYDALYDVVDSTLGNVSFLLEEETSERAKGLVKKMKEIDEEWEKIRWPKSGGAE